MPSPQFLVDANVLMEAANTYYTFARVPGFWDWLKAAVIAGNIRTVEFVLDEIEHPAELVQWVDDLGSESLTIDLSDPAVQGEYQNLVNWVVAQNYGPEHVATFLDKADPWLIAAARVHGLTVVTQETLAGLGTKKVKIPNLCEAHGVGWSNTFTMLDTLGATF